MNHSQWEACMYYFHGKSVYGKLFTKFREKYISLGHMGGSVVLTDLTLEEKVQLGGFLQKNYRGNQSVTVSAAAFQKALDDSRFQGILMEDLLKGEGGEPLLGRQRQKELQEQEREEFFRGVLEQAMDKSGAEWLEGVWKDKKPGYKMVMQLYREEMENRKLREKEKQESTINRESLMQILRKVLTAAAHLPVYEEKCKRLPVFAAEVTGNPHTFDENTVCFRLLSLYITSVFQMEREEGIAGPEWNNRVLFRAGILKDDLSNTTLAYGIHGIMEGGGCHPGIEGFLQRGEPVQLTLQTLSRLKDVCPRGRMETTDPVCSYIYVIENPAVFSAFIEYRPDICIVCGNGQPRLATLVLLDMLSGHGVLRYAGDFDPEGLTIAQNLKSRYGGKMEFWGYHPVLYEKYAASDPLSSQSLSKLEKIYEEKLGGIKEAILSCRKAAYQESMIEEYLQDLI